MKTNKMKLAVAAALLSSSAVALAQVPYVRPAYQYPTVPEGSGPASIQVGSSPIYFTPYLGAAVGRDDNLFLSSSNEKSSTLYIVSPGFRLDARDPNKYLQLSMNGQFGRYSSSEDDDYNDYSLRASGDFAFSRRNFLRLGYDYIRGHDPRGSTDRPLAGRPDRYKLSSPSILYAFGAPGAQGRLEAYYGQGNKRYLNNRTTTVFSDRDTREFGAAFYWRVMPKTYALVEARRTNLEYKLSNSPLDSREERYYAGVMWEATAATTGTIKVGRLEKKFDRVNPDFSGTSWEALITWAPRTYSKFDFYAARATNESTGLGSFILSDIYGVAWTHAWSSAWSTAADLRFQKDDYQGFDRNDDIASVGLKVGYRFRRWLTLGAEYNFTKRDSNRAPFEYDKNLYLLTATMSM